MSTVLLKRVSFAVLFLAALLIPLSHASPFDVGSLLLKVSLTEGKTASKSLSVSSSEGGDFDISVVGVKGVSVSDKSFTLSAGGARTVDVNFDSKGLSPGVYVGSIKITSGKDSSYIPIIFEVDSEDVFFKASVDIPPQYNKISPGDKLLAQLKIFDLTSGGTSDGLGTTHVGVEYRVYTIDGAVLVSDVEDVIVDRQAQLTKTFSFPKDVKKGDYILAVIMTYKSSITVSTNIFSIGDAVSNPLFDFGSSSTSFLLIIVAIAAFFLIVIGLFIYFVRDRDKLLVELKSYHQDELRKMHRFLLAQERIIAKKNKAATPAIREEIKNKIEHLKKTHLQREKHFRMLKSKGNLDEMRRQIDDWKTKGYNTLAMEYKLKELGSKDMASLLSYWKRNYTTKSIKTTKNNRVKR